MSKPARRIHVFGAGPPKSGTHSIEALFAAKYRASHEPRRARIIETVLAEAFGWISKSRAEDLWVDIQEEANLEIVSSHHNVHFIEAIVNRYPNSKIILTIREAYDWVDSHINHEINRVADMRLTALRDYRFGNTRFSHELEEQILKDNGVATLRGYLNYWAWNYQHIIDTVPADRLMVIRLPDLKKKTEEVADFVGIDTNDLTAEKSHQFKGLGPSHLLEQIPRDYLEAQFQKYTGPLMQRYYPEIKSIEDSRILKKG